MCVYVYAVGWRPGVGNSCRETARTLAPPHLVMRFGGSCRETARRVEPDTLVLSVSGWVCTQRERMSMVTVTQRRWCGLCGFGMCCHFGSEHIRLLLSCIFPHRSLHVFEEASVIVVIGFGCGGRRLRLRCHLPRLPHRRFTNASSCRSRLARPMSSSCQSRTQYGRSPCRSMSSSASPHQCSSGSSSSGSSWTMLLVSHRSRS